MAQVPASFFEQNYVWQTFFELHNSYVEIVLTYNRLLPSGESIKFDEDPEGILDLSIDADDHLVMDGFLALIPEGKLLSCSMRSVKHTLLVWEQSYRKHVFAEYDKQKVLAEFEGRLWNPDSSADFLFVGGGRDAHSISAIEHWAKVLEGGVVHRSDTDWLSRLEQILGIYKRIIYTQTTEIYMLARNEEDIIRQVRADLSEIASRYGFILPPESIENFN